MFLPANTHMYEFVIVLIVFVLLMMNALATFVPRYTLRNNKRKSKENADHEKYLGQAHGHIRLSNTFTGLFSVGRGCGEPSLYRNQYNV